MVRRTEILGKLLHHMTENTRDINKKVTEDIQKWAEQVGIKLMQNFQEMDQRLPKGEVMQTILGQSGAVQNMVFRVEELVKNITQVETEQEQQRAGVEEDIRRKVGDGLSKMQRDLDNSIPRMVDMHLSEFAHKVEQSMHTLKDVVVKDRFNDQQRSHDLRNAITTLQAKVDSQEQRLSTIGYQVCTVDFELTANKYVDHQELREVTKEMNGVTDNMDEVEQEIEQVKAMLQVQLGRPAPVHQSAPRFSTSRTKKSIGQFPHAQFGTCHHARRQQLEPSLQVL